jgi:hypothetical protein
LVDNKQLKNILTGIGLLFLVIGQVLLLGGKQLVLGAVFTAICVVLFALAFTEKYTVIIDFFTKLGAFASNLFKPAPPRPKAVKAKDLKIGAAQVKGAALPVKVPGPGLMEFLEKFGREGIKFFIPKWMFFAAVIALFVVAQFMFFGGKLFFALLLLVAAIIILAAALVLKEDGVPGHLNLGSGLKVLSMFGGIALIIAGWVLLTNMNLKLEQWGVALTIPGCILAYLGLPKSDIVPSQEPDTRTDILFLKPDILNNYFVKAGLLILSFISLKIGNNVIQSQDYNMYSMIFYAITIALLFFALPLFNFSEKSYENKYLDIAKLVFVAVAIYIAYLGQKDFVANKTNDGVVKFFIAAFIFIFSFPIYSSKVQEEKEPFPIQMEIIFMVAILLVGLYLRVHELDQRPFGLENDEAGGYTARMARNGDITLPLSVGNFGLPLHIVQLFILFFGELNRMSIKMLGVSVGFLSIPMVYFFIRSVVNPRSAIFATTMFAFLRWNLHFSRSGHGYVFSNAVEIMFLYFTLKAIETRKKFIWLLAGFCMGLTWHGIMTAFLLIVPMALYFIISSFSRKDFLKANVVGVFAFMIGFWIFGSMIVHNFFISKSIYFGRAYEVSVFSKDPNAPSKNPAKGIVENTRLVLEMFNGMGDSRQRNSGGNPYEPTIDFVSSMLFAVGFIYSMYYSRYYLFFIMVMVFFSQAAGSIFSIEAPSAMRAVGTMIPVVFFIAFIFDKIWLSFRRVFGKKLEVVYLPVLLAVFLIPIIKDNYYQYFGRWVGGMDELTTATGKYTRALGNKWQIVLYTVTYYPGHPPFKINRDTKANSAGRLTTALMHLYTVDDDNFALLFHYDTWENMDMIKNVYFPDSKIEVVDHKFFNPKLKPGEGFGTFAKAVLVTNDELKKRRGLTGDYSFGGAPVTNEEPVFKPADDAKVPYSVTWKGDFMARYYGNFRFFNNGNAKYTLSIDGKTLGPDKTATLAEGFHKLVITARRASVSDRLAISADSQELIGTVIRSREVIKLDSKYLYNFKIIGLHGSYFNGDFWDPANKDSEIIDANMWFDGSIYTTSASWTGTIDIKDPGEYFITTSNSGYVRIVIDGKSYWESSGNQKFLEEATGFFKNSPLQRAQSFNLKKGKHKILIYNLNSNIMHLMWNKAGQPSVPVPIDILEPDYEITKINP